MLGNIDTRFEEFEVMSRDDIYYTREAVCFTLDGRRVELMTISSYHNISSEREIRLKNLFPEETVPRPFRFIGKKVVCKFVSIFNRVVYFLGDFCIGASSSRRNTFQLCLQWLFEYVIKS